jgi:predicted amidohydrolase
VVEFKYHSKFKIFKDDNADIFNFTLILKERIMQDLRVTLIQTNLFWEDAQKNFAHFEKVLDRISGHTDLILMPETFNTGFSINPALCAESPDGAGIQFLKEQAKKKDAVLMATLLVCEDGGCYNRLVCMHPDGNFETYDKRHLFRLSEEYKIFRAGNIRVIFEVNGWKISPAICYDLRFPVWNKNTWNEGLYAYDLLICLANWPASRAHVWKTLLMARAIENQAFVAGVNRIGDDGHGTWHSGDSMAVDAKGHVMFAAGAGEERIETVTFSAADLMLFRESFTVGMDWDQFTIEASIPDQLKNLK